MDVLPRLQPLDILFTILWAGIVGWGLQTGAIRQFGMLVAVYGGALISGAAYRQGGSALGLIFGRDLMPQLEFFAYLGLFIIIFGLVGLLIWRAYPASRLNRGFGAENVLGAVISAIWGILLLIALLTVLRFYAVVPWKGQDQSQQGILHQVQQSQVAPVLEVVAAPLWQVMTPWFPAPVNTHL